MTQNDMQVAITGLRDEQIAALKELLQESTIKDRSIGGGRRVKYIKGDTAIDAANRIFGFGQWGYKVIARGREIIEDPKKGKIEMYTADIELSVAGASFTFPGDGVGIVNDPYTVEMHEKARKEAATDAVKRALRHYGDQFGLSLYNEDDYIEASDGTIKQVKQAQPGRVQAPAPTRIVESQNVPRQIEQSKDLSTIPTVKHLHTMAAALNLDWDACLLNAFDKPIKEGKVTIDALKKKGDELPPGYCQRLASYLQSLQLA